MVVNDPNGSSSLAQAFDSLTPQQMRERGSLKWSQYPGDVVGAWVAEMDLGTAPAVEAAIHQAMRHGLLGYMPPSVSQRVREETVRYQREAFGWEVEVELAPLSNELIQRWGQVVTLGLQNGILHKTEARSLFLDRLQPINARPINDLPVSEEILAAKSLADPNAVQDSVAKKSNSRTGVGAMSDGTNANRDEAGGETLA